MNQLKLFFNLTFIIAFVILLSGCGQNGPLYLPDPTTQSTTGETHE
ncbi:MAG: lipoprotein [Gammaproteobacteria bacterium]|nr:lipoprotein [Gammaproteobacteria bacterium]